MAFLVGRMRLGSVDQLSAGDKIASRFPQKVKSSMRSSKRNSRSPQRNRQLLKRHLFEQLEPRVLLAADLVYPATEIVNDFTLRVVSGGANPQVDLVRTTSNVQVASATLTAAGDTQVNIRSSSAADLRGDVIRIDTPSLNLLNTFVTANGGSFTINFDGGLDIATGLPLPIADDALRLEGSGAYGVGFSLIVISTSDVTIAPGSPTFTGSFTAKSLATNSGQADATDPTKFISIPHTAISLASGVLKATAITLEATSTVNVTIDRTTALSGSLSFGQVIVDSRATIDLTGNDAGNRTRLESTTGAISITAASQVTTSVARVPQNDGNAADDDRADDASVAVSVITSKSDVHIGGTIDVVSATTLTVNSNNTTNITTVADGLNGTSDAGGTLATSNTFGDTTLLIDGVANVQAAGNLALNSTSNRTATTTSTTTVKGATKDTTKPNTKGQQALADNNASTSDGNMGLAAAVTILTISGDTTARIVDATVRSTSGTLGLNASARKRLTQLPMA